MELSKNKRYLVRGSRAIYLGTSRDFRWLGLTSPSISHAFIVSRWHEEAQYWYMVAETVYDCELSEVVEVP